MANKKKRFLYNQKFNSRSERWKHILDFLVENRENITSKGLNNEAAFQLGGEMLVIKGKKRK